MRSEQHPDWLVSALMKVAITPRDHKDQPIGQTFWSWDKVQARVRFLLENSGTDLNKRELNAGTYWLTTRITNLIGTEDKDEQVEELLDHHVNHYLVDKTTQRLTGKSDRSPIYTREWWEKHFTPGPEEQAKGGEARESGAGGDEEADQGGRGASARLAVAAKNVVYVGIDGDNIGSLVEETLQTDDPEAAQRISESIHQAHDEIRKVVKNYGGKVIFDGGDNMLLHLTSDPELFERLREIYVENTSHTATIGVGARPVEAHYALVVGKNTGKDRVVVYSPEVVKQLDEIRRKQQELDPIHQQLKYRASATDLDAGKHLKGAMWELKIPVTDEAVYDLMFRLIEKNALDEIGSLEQFFSQERESLKEKVREVYARRQDWNLRTAGRRMTDFEMDATASDLRRMVEAATIANTKIQQITALIGGLDAPLTEAARGLTTAANRLLAAAMEFAGLMDRGLAVYTDQVRELSNRAASINSMIIPFGQDVDLTLRALDNAQVEHLSDVPQMPVDSRQVIARSLGLTRELAEAAMLTELLLLTAKADVRLMVAGDRPENRERRMPGADNVPQGGRHQRSPHKRTDWLTIEEYNRDQADWSRTDQTYVGGNITPDAERMSGGGEPGPAVYTP